MSSSHMNNYQEFIENNFIFPQDEFEVDNNQLIFNDVPVMELIKKYGTPLKLTYLPKISQNIQRSKKLFNVGIAKVDYKGTYHYCYCTKSSHFSFVLDEALKNDIYLETSSAFDIPIIKTLHQTGKITKDITLICNGYKRPNYQQAIADLVNDGWSNVIPILDNLDEINHYEKSIKKNCNLGIRIACAEEPDNEFYTARLGVRASEIVNLYEQRIKGSKRFKLKMLHFFINTGIKDNPYYWNELSKNIRIYCALKKVCPELDSIDIGGGFPIKTSLSFKYDYEFMAEHIVKTIKEICNDEGVDEPNIYTEFGSYTVGESGAIIYSVIDTKLQNDNELWYMIDSSFITTLPDTWGIKQQFVFLAINNWDKPFDTVNLGGITCDGEDFYNYEEKDNNQIFLPKYDKKNPLYIGFFHTGAYQESIGGYGGIQHCLIPAPKHILIDKDGEGGYTTKLFAKEQSAKSMMNILGY